MIDKKDQKIEIGKTWVAPELKKISIEQITAGQPGSPQSDGSNGFPTLRHS